MRRSAVIPASTAAVILGAACLAAGSPAFAGDSSDTGGAAAVAKKRPAPRFPQSELEQNKQGWVQLGFVVTAKGKVVDPVIEASSGNRLFENAALEAVSDWRYEPATLDGEPVEQAFTRTMITFTIEDDRLRGVTKWFAAESKRVGGALDAGALQEARERIDKMWLRPDLNAFEQAWLAILESEYAAKSGDADSRLDWLDKAAVGDGRWLPGDKYIDALLTITALKLDSGDFSGALEGWSKLSALDTGERDLSGLDGYIRELEEIVASDSIIAVDARLERAEGCETCEPRWRYEPLRHEFAFSRIEGNVENFELRCERHRLGGVPAEGPKWRIPDAWGACHVIVSGGAGATFRFLELP